MAQWDSANVFQLDRQTRRLWRFSTSGAQARLEKEFTAQPSQTLPIKFYSKDWRSLFDKRLNVAWIPASNIYLRTIQLPASEPAEIVSMVELQLEKLSPLPVAQVVWALETLPKREDGQQTVIVIVVAREVVEKFLGQLEVSGYLADRLEIPLLEQMLATTISGDGVWIYPDPENPSAYLVAWWYAGALQNLTLLSLPEGPQSLQRLREQLEQMAWAGEIEGWFSGAPQWHLVAEGEQRDLWSQWLLEVTGQAPEVFAPVASDRLATLSAQRSLARLPMEAGLLPGGYAEKYRQQYIDRLWMRGLGAVGLVYLIGVVIYFAGLEVVKYQRSRVQARVTAISGSYTNTLKLEKKIEVLEQRQALRYAALDCWTILAELLPADMTLNRMQFTKNHLELNGSVPRDSETQVTDLTRSLRQYNIDGHPFFKEVNSPTISPYGNDMNWRLSGTVRTGEVGP